MSRHFTRSAAEVINFNPGGAAALGTAAMAIATIWRATTVHAGGLVRANNASVAKVHSVNPFSDGFLYFSVNGFQKGPAYVAGQWYLTILTKATGAAVPRLHTFSYGGAWTHVDAAGTIGNATNGPTTAFEVGHETSAEYLDGDIAVMGLFSTGFVGVTDLAIEAAGLQTTLANWLSFSPVALWPFNQASVATPVPDVSSTGTATQTTITGTSVTTDPPGFSYALTGSATLNPGVASRTEQSGGALLVPGTATLSPGTAGRSEQSGGALLAPGTVALAPGVAAVGENIGNAALQPGAAIIAPGTVQTGGTFGGDTLQPGIATLLPGVIGWGERFGGALILSPTAQTVSPGSMGWGERFGSISLAYLTEPDPRTPTFTVRLDRQKFESDLTRPIYKIRLDRKAVNAVLED